jgi:hypothetical protein
MADEIISDPEQKLTSLFQPDMLLSHQYFATLRSRRLEPEKRLMLAVLEDAVACFQKYVLPRNRRERILFNETEDWVCDENGDYLFSFEYICEVLNFNPKCLREGLLRWKQQKLTQRQKIQLISISSTRHGTLVRKNDAGSLIKGVKQACQSNKVARLG